MTTETQATITTTITFAELDEIRQAWREFAAPYQKVLGETFPPRQLIESILAREITRQEYDVVYNVLSDELIGCPDPVAVVDATINGQVLGLVGNEATAAALLSVFFGRPISTVKQAQCLLAAPDQPRTVTAWIPA